MATVIQIKRSTGASAPAVSDLAEGELAYVQDRSNDGASAKLFIESVDSGSSAVIHEIGGKYYTDIVGGSKATPSDFLVGNGSTSGGTLKLIEDSDNGTNFVGIKAPDSVGSNVTFTMPSADGSANQVLGTNGSGQLSFLSTTSTLAGATDSDISSPGAGHVLVHDGSDSFDNVALSGDVTMTSAGVVTIGSNAVQVGNIDFLVDEDNMASDSAVKVPSQQSVKAYVDSQVTAQDLDLAGDSGTGAVDLDSQSITFTGGTGVTTSASGQAVTFAIGQAVATTDNVTFNNVDVDGTLTSDDITSTNIAATGNLTVSGNLTVNGTTTTVNSTTVSVDDPVFELGESASDDNLDRGIKFNWHNGSSAKVGFFGMDDSDGKFKFIQDATDTSSVFSGSVGNVAFGGIEGTSLALSGSITSVDGAAPTAGQLMIGNGSNGDMELATLTAGEGLDVTNADGSITISAEEATASNLGVASFSASYFTVSSGDVSINDATASAKGIASFSSDNFTVSSGAVTVTAIDGGTF
tara:strand:- start:2238 stop:3806 length:1569 start_codon:yes stop_codon:yes gene_type:complete